MTKDEAGAFFVRQHKVGDRAHHIELGLSKAAYFALSWVAAVRFRFPLSQFNVLHAEIFEFQLWGEPDAAHKEMVGWRRRWNVKLDEDEQEVKLVWCVQGFDDEDEIND